MAGPGDQPAWRICNPAHGRARDTWPARRWTLPGADVRGGKTVMSVGLTVAQAIVRFLIAQRAIVGVEDVPFFPGVLGIFGHGNVAGVGQALLEREQAANDGAEGAQGHDPAATTSRATSKPRSTSQLAMRKMKNRLQTFACTSSIGPGATNMLTGAATATVNRLPGPAPARRHSSRGATSHRCCSSWSRRAVTGCLGQRLLQAGEPLLGSDQSSGATADRPAVGAASADRPGRNRRRHAGVTAGRADRGIRLSGRPFARGCGEFPPARRPDRQALRPRRSGFAPAARWWSPGVE